MTPRQSRAFAVSAHPPLGKPLRQVYLDEAGIGNLDHEPIAVVAGIIVNPDEHYRLLADYMNHLAEEYASEEFGLAIFHAKDIFHGSGRFPRANWKREERLELMRKLSAIPARFKLPVVAGYIDRVGARKFYETTQTLALPGRTIRNLEQGEAFILATASVDEWMQTKAGRDEVAMITAERTGKAAQSAVAMLHKGVQTPDDPTNPIAFHGFRSDRIVDAVHFADKINSIFLQVSDVCAFVIKRHLMGREDVSEFYEAMQPYILIHPKR